MWITIFGFVSMVIWTKVFSVLLEKRLSGKQLIWIYLMWLTVAGTVYILTVRYR